MSAERITFGWLLRRAARSWRPKLASLVAAVLVWLFATTNNVTTTQGHLTIPLVVEGVGDEQIAVGLPASVEVVVSGPAPRVNRLRPDMFRATLDLTDVVGEFERGITVQPPAEIRVLEVVPTDVIGFLESMTSRQLPVSASLTGPLPDNLVVTATVEPPSVTLTGRGLVLDRVARVLAVTNVAGGEALLVALDVTGAPVSELSISPATARVSVESRQALVTKAVALEVATPSAANLTTITVSHETVEVAGESSVIANLSSVLGSVEPPSAPVAPGRYTLPVRLELPSGVAALTNPTATLVYVDSPVQP